MTSCFEQKKTWLNEHFSVSGWAAIITICTNSKYRSSSYSTYLHTSSKYHKIIPLTDLQTKKKQHFWFNHMLQSLVPFEHFTHLDLRPISMKLLPFVMQGKVLKKEPSSSCMYFVILFLEQFCLLVIIINFNTCPFCSYQHIPLDYVYSYVYHM